MPSHPTIRKGVACIAVLASLAALLGAAPACALGRSKMFGLTVIVETPDGRHARSFGSLRGFMQSLKRAGRVCRLDDYEHGVNVDCGAPPAPDVLIDFDYAPSLSPEFALVDSLRTKGRNGGELPTAKRARFLAGFARISSTATPY